MADKENLSENVSAEGEESQKPSEYDGVVSGKYAWDKDVQNRKNADSDVAGEAITKYAWSDGRKTVSIYIELEGLDDVAEDALHLSSSERELSFVIDNIAGKRRGLALSGLLHEIDGVKLSRKIGKNTVVLKLQKKEETHWWKLVEAPSASAPAAPEDGDEQVPPGMLGGMDFSGMDLGGVI
mmetsp:Transcript_29229/g.67289  ORF Transcript_29229/g.67289 Transcript_29229/m.67289 type:complete len:182 (-) Transcript_29229:66-611(-)